MTPIETARKLLSDASPELRRAVGELVKESMYFAIMDRIGNYTWRGAGKPYDVFARELIETKSETKEGME